MNFFLRELIVSTLLLNAFFYFAGLFLASPGEDCLSHCPKRRLICVRKINLKNSQAKFEELGKQCKDKTSQATCKEAYHPAFIEKDNICAGFKDIPALISCNATPPSDGKTRRLCNCQDLGRCRFRSRTFSCCISKKRNFIPKSILVLQCLFHCTSDFKTCNLEEKWQSGIGVSLV